MIVDKINAYLSSENKTLNEALADEVGKLTSYNIKRQFMDNSKNESRLRVSSLGKGARALSYIHHGFEQNGKEIDARASMLFFTGDVVETTITALITLSGLTVIATGLNQIKVNFRANGSVIEGHPDGLLVGENEIYLLEVKSMSSYSFSSFEKGIIDPTYISQMQAYMAALNLQHTIIVGYNKDNGLLHEKIIKRDEATILFLKEKLKLVLNSTKEKLPERCFEPDEKGFYPWNCAYCAYHTTCLIEPGLAEKVVVKNAYKLKKKEN